MDINELLADLFARVDEHVHEALDDLDTALLTQTPAPGANPIGWLVWHLSRVQDHHVSELLGVDQLWVSGEWAAGCGVSADPHNTGYGHTADQVASIRPRNAQVLIDYHEAVAARTRGLLASTTESDLDRIVDRRWNPPVTLGVRLISVADDDIQHAGQACYVRRTLEHR